MSMRKPGIGTGVLDPKRRVGKFAAERFYPSETLAPFVEHFWEVRWDLPDGESFTQHNIPYPALHIVFEAGRSEVVGPIRGRFTREILGRGRVVGVHVRPGMFRAFSETTPSALVDRQVPTWTVLPPDAHQVRGLENEILALDFEMGVAIYDRALCSWLRDGAPSDACLRARDLVELVQQDRSIRRAEDLSKHASMSLRSLQRLFKNEVGLSPKLVISRFRLMEASELLVDDPSSGAELAADLGYADQAHFIRAFKRMVGTTPDRYTRRNR